MTFARMQEGGRRALALAGLLAGFAGIVMLYIVPATIAATAILRGQWLIEIEQDDQDRIEFTVILKDGNRNNHWSGRDVAIGRFSGLTRDQVEGPPTDTRFELIRDAGTLLCEGRVGENKGAGLFELRLDPEFPDALARRGVGRPSEAQQVKLALADAGFELLDELKAQRYPTPNLEMFVRMSDHGVNLDYVRGMSQLGHRTETLEGLVKARDHGVDPRYVKGMAELGHRDLTLAELIELRDHGVDPRYIRAMHEAGHKLSLAELRRARDHGVDARYISEMAAAGHDDLPMETLMRSRDHGVDPRYIAEMRRLGYRDLTLDQLIRLRDHGVDGRFVSALQEEGYKNVSLDLLVRTRNHGVDARFAKRANERAGERLPLERLIQLKNRGWND